MSGLRRVVLGAGLLVLAACAHPSHRASLNVPLIWSPTDSTELGGDVLTAFDGQTVAVTAGLDERAPPRSSIGANREEATPRPVTTHDDPLAFVTAQLGRVLRQNTVDVVSSHATRVLRIDLKDLFIEEDNTYHGRIVLAATLEDEQGTRLWRGIIRGDNHRMGHSFTPENYEQTLSDTILDAAGNLLGKPEFQRAVRGH